MPPRWICAAIWLGWLASSAWFFRLEFWPALEPDAPPPFTIDLVDETQASKLPIVWYVYKNEKLQFRADTTVEHRPLQNDFTLRAVFTKLDEPGGKLDIHSMDSAYRVTPEGRLLGLRLFMEFNAPGLPHCQAIVRGEVKNGEFDPHLEISQKHLPGGKLSFTPPPVAVSTQGAVVMPLHPLNRIGGLKRGQTWRVPLFDPVGAATGSFTGDAGRTRYLRAKVRPQTEMLHWKQLDVPCFVIEYHEENASLDEALAAETWVSELDDMVLKQVAEQGGERWVMERQSTR